MQLSELGVPNAITDSVLPNVPNRFFSVPKPNIWYFLKVPNTETECLFFPIRYSVFSVITEYRIDYRMPGKITECTECAIIANLNFVKES